MSSQQQVDPQSAEARFRQAFERLKDGRPKMIEPGTPVTQNNVAREAGCDPSALKKVRFPALIREIQAYIELHKVEDQASARKAARQRAAKRSLEKRLEDATRQRDQANSILASANLRIVELSDEVRALQREIDELRPPPTKLGRR